MDIGNAISLLLFQAIGTKARAAQLWGAPNPRGQMDLGLRGAWEEVSGRDAHKAIVDSRRDLGGPEATFAKDSGIPKERGIGIFELLCRCAQRKERVGCWMVRGARFREYRPQHLAGCASGSTLF